MTVCVLVVVMSEKEVLERRVRIKKKKMIDAPIQLSSQQEETIQELLCGHRSTFDSAFYRFRGFRVCEWLQACLMCRHRHCFNFCCFYFCFLFFAAYGQKPSPCERVQPVCKRALVCLLTLLLLLLVVLLQSPWFLWKTREPRGRTGPKKQCFHCSSTRDWPHNLHDPGHH